MELYAVVKFLIHKWSGLMVIRNRTFSVKNAFSVLATSSFLPSTWNTNKIARTRAAILDREANLRKQATCQSSWSRKEEVADGFVDVPGLSWDFFLYKDKKNNNTVVYISNCSQVSVLTAKHNPLLVIVYKAHGKLHSAK